MDECLSGFAKCWSLLEFDYSAQALNNALPADVPVFPGASVRTVAWNLIERTQPQSGAAQET